MEIINDDELLRPKALWGKTNKQTNPAVRMQVTKRAGKDA